MARTGAITPNFDWSETAVSTSHPTLVDEVPPECEAAVIHLATSVLQPIRDREGEPLPILSWYRGVALNIAVGGSGSSQHRKGEAADFTCSNTRRAFERLLQEKYVPCGQVIWYPDRRFVHVALPSAKYPEPSFHVHWLKHALNYRKVNSVAELSALVKVTPTAAQRQ